MLVPKCTELNDNLLRQLPKEQMQRQAGACLRALEQRTSCRKTNRNTYWTPASLIFDAVR